MPCTWLFPPNSVQDTHGEYNRHLSEFKEWRRRKRSKPSARAATDCATRIELKLQPAKQDVQGTLVTLRLLN
jgi:hypothetical protein